MIAALVLSYELALVATSVALGFFLAESFTLIPRWLIRLPGATLTGGDVQMVYLVFVSASALVFGALRIFASGRVFLDVGRTVTEIYGLVVALSLAAVALFLATAINFDPELMLGIGLSAFATFVASFLLAPLLAAQRKTWLLGRLKQLAMHGGRRLASVAGLLTLLIAASPITMAKLYVSDRDFANWVTRVRVAINVRGTLDWTFVDAFPGVTFHQPIDLTYPPDGSPYVYVLERHGRLWRLPTDAPADKELLLDFSARVGEVEAENGALGFDLHPAFGAGTSDYAFVYYTDVRDGRQVNRLSRFDLARPTADERAASEQPLMTIGRNNSGYHNGGSVVFGPDGFLHVAIGEATERAVHQRIDRKLLGGIMRIDVDRKGGEVSHPIRRQPLDGRTEAYFIPSDNPFNEVTDALPEFWALGLRNPFRISFDPGTGALWAGEVGSTAWEEINVIEKGGNYQYPYVEGAQATGAAPPEDILGSEISPIYSYRHTAFERAVIGGIVYRGTKHPELRGQYLFGDNYSGNVYAFPAASTSAKEPVNIARVRFIAQHGLTAFVESPEADILVTAMGSAARPSGRILKLVRRDEADTDELVRVHTEDAATAAAEVQPMFSTNCRRCHGRFGQGDGPDAGNLPEGVEMPDLTDPAWHAARTDEEIGRVIRDGGASVGMNESMPPWRGILSEAEISALVKHIRTFERES